jgi:hypothetical protein
MNPQPTLMQVRTAMLEIACEVSGPEHGAPVILLHGFPDDPRIWDRGIVNLLGITRCDKVTIWTHHLFRQNISSTGFLSSSSATPCGCTFGSASAFVMSKSYCMTAACL